MIFQSRPEDVIYFYQIMQQGNQITEERVIIKASSNLYFPGVEMFRRALNEAIEDETDGRSSFLIVDLSNITEIDYTALKVSILLCSL